MRSPLKQLYCSLVCLAATAGILGVQPSPARAQDPAPKPPRFAAEIAAFEAADRKMPPPAGGVLFIGSSSIRLWKTLARDFPDLTVINRGFGGSQIEDSVRYAPRIVLPYRPRLIVMYAGSNDLNAGKTPQQVARDFRRFVETVHAALPGTRIAYVSINPSVARWSQEERVLEANRLIAEYIRENDGKTGKLSYLDSHAKLLSPEGKPRPELLRPDGLHLNSDGYALWTAILKPEILRLAGPEK